MPLRSPKMNRLIFGFHRRFWWPKWTPASSSCFMDTTGVAMGCSPLPTVSRSPCRAPSRATGGWHGWKWTLAGALTSHRPSPSLAAAPRTLLRRRRRSWPIRPGPSRRRWRRSAPLARSGRGGSRAAATAPRRWRRGAATSDAASTLKLIGRAATRSRPALASTTTCQSPGVACWIGACGRRPAAAHRRGWRLWPRDRGA